MGFFNFIESFFFISLAITFVLIMMIIYHFKERINVIEKKNETTIDILNNLAKEVTGLRGFVLQMNSVQPPMPAFLGGGNSPFFQMVSSMDGRDGYSQRNNITIDLEEDDENICVEHLNIGEDLSNSIIAKDVDEDDEDSDSDDSSSDEEEDDDADDADEADDAEEYHGKIEKIVVLDEPAAPAPEPATEPTPVYLDDITEVPVSDATTTEPVIQIPEDYTKLTNGQLKNIVLDKKIYEGNVNKLKRLELLKLLQAIRSL
jgi:hypothetical protein